MQVRKFVQRQPEERRNNYTGSLPAIDKTRATAVLVRQSKDGADTAQAESRETQLGLQDYGKLLYSSDTPDVRLYDEGAGVSGQKRIDQRKKLNLLYQDMNKGIIGTIVVAREDRLFRNKHMDQVGVFTKLADEKKIKLIVPPISSAASDEETRVYDFTIYADIRAFQEKMKESYGYIEGHVKYMNQCNQNKADKGGYDGRALPPGFAVKGKKQNQIIVIYEPWAKKMKWLVLRAQALDWDMGKLNREVAQMVFLFPEIPDEDRERYIFKTNLHHIPGVGYKPRDHRTIKRWLTNEMYIGWWQPDEEKPDTITDHHPAVLDGALFAEGYARLTGYTLEGKPVENPRGITRIRKDREAPPDALFHGKLIATPPSIDRTAFVSVDEAYHVSYYKGHSAQKNGILRDVLFAIPVAPFDDIVIQRLKELVATDKNIADKVESTLVQVFNQQGEDFASIHDQLKGIEEQLANLREKSDSIGEEILKEKNNLKKANLETSPKLEMWERKLAKSIEQEQKLLATQAELEAKKKKLGIMDSPEDIARVHRLLGNFDVVWPKFDLAQRQRAFSLFINRIEVQVVSPHWLHLSIDWLDAICPRIDDAYVWRVTGTYREPLSEQEKEIIKQHYPSSSRLEILKLLPERTCQAIQTQAHLMHIEKDVRVYSDIPLNSCYRDFDPKLGGNYLFGNYETTLDCIKRASSNTRKSKAPLYALWLLSEKVEDLASLVECDLGQRDRTIRVQGRSYAYDEGLHRDVVGPLDERLCRNLYAGRTRTLGVLYAGLALGDRVLLWR